MACDRTRLTTVMEDEITKRLFGTTLVAPMSNFIRIMVLFSRSRLYNYIYAQVCRTVEAPPLSPYLARRRRWHVLRGVKAGRTALDLFKGISFYHQRERPSPRGTAAHFSNHGCSPSISELAPRRRGGDDQI